VFLPARNRRLVPLRGFTCRTLDAPPHLPQQPPDMAGMQAHAALSLDQLGHTRQRPQVVEEAVGLGAAHQRLLQLLLVGRGQLGPPTQWPTLPGGPAHRLALLLPAQCGGSADAAATGDFRLGHALAQQAHSLPSPLFHAVEIPLELGRHAGRLCYLFMRESIIGNRGQARGPRNCDGCLTALQRARLRAGSDTKSINRDLCKTHLNSAKD
jgi:hypothetical protein